MMAAPPPKTPTTCLQCGNNGHSGGACSEHSAASCTDIPPPQAIFIFGVNISESPTSPSTPPSTSSMMRKSMSMNNMYEAHHHQQQQNNNDSSSYIGDGDKVTDVVASGYASDDNALHVSPGNPTRERKRGIPWTEEEHRQFLMGLDSVGKGDWRGIARNYVKTRTPTQVASHAQKYFLRQTNLNRRRRRSSLFDITTDTMTRSMSDSQLSSRGLSAASSSSPSPSPLRPISSIQGGSTSTLAVPPSSKMASLNLNHSPTSTYSATNDRESEPLLSLKLSSPAPTDEESSRPAQSPTFGGFNGSGDSIISVA